MKYRKLGRTGLKCSEVGLGTWAFGTNVYGDISENESLTTIRTALDLGINFFDTAPLYGTDKQDGVAEMVLGRGLGVRRDQVIISTKFGRNPTDGCAANFHAKRVKSSVEESLKRLGTDRLDVLFFHSPFSPSEINDDVWDALATLKAEGKVRFVGHSISKFQETKAMSAKWSAERKIDVIQVVYSLLNREATQLINDLGKADVGIVARESLANGFLSGTISKDSSFSSNHLNARYTKEEIIERVEQVEKLSFLVGKKVSSMPQAAMRWVLDNPNISLVLTGAKTVREVRECAVASDLPSYSSEELQLADSVHVRDFAAA